LAIIILIIVGGGVIYASTKDSQVFDVFYSPEVRKHREIARLQKKFFPESISGYILSSRDLDKIRVEDEECSEMRYDIDSSSGTQDRREVCIQEILGEYRQSGGNTIIFVHLAHYTKGSEVSKELTEKFVKKEKLGTFSVFHWEPHEIGWFPSSSFNLINIQEGTWELDGSGGENYRYLLPADGNNPVLQYYLQKYPPAS